MNKFPQNLDGQNLHIGIVQSRFSNEISMPITDTCIRQLKALNVADNNISVVTVPGALEIPIMLQNLALSNEFHALIAIGVIIRGETYHFDIVANESAAGITRVALDFNLPIINAILTTENEQQANDRVEIKAIEAAQAAIECANLALNFNLNLEKV